MASGKRVTLDYEADASGPGAPEPLVVVGDKPATDAQVKALDKRLKKIEDALNS